MSTTGDYNTTTAPKRLEPWDELSPESLRKVNAITESIHKAVDSRDVNLATDPIKVPGQNWACVSFVSPDSTQKCKSIGMKIRGVFDTQEEAKNHIQQLIRLDPTFDIFICDMYNWCLVPPDPEQIGNQEYQDETLNGIISGYRKNQIFAKEHFEERKREMMAQAADEARRATLRRIEEESKREMEEADVKPLEEQTDRIIDITEVETSEKLISESSPSELMESMVNGFKRDLI